MRRQAFSLVEMLAVIAIVLFLVGMMMPTAQRSRDAADKLACMNRLASIGLACHLYQDSHGHLPPLAYRVNQTVTDSPWLPASDGASWAVAILPWLEQKNLHAKWDASRSYYDQSTEARLTPVGSYFCPGRRTAYTEPQVSISGDWPTPEDKNVPGALGDYALNFGSADLWTLQPPNGVVTLDGTTISFREISDGHAHTILAGEKHVPFEKFGMAVLDNSIYNGHQFDSCIRGVFPNPMQLSGLAQSLTENAWKWGSWHAGMPTNFVMCDRSVRTLANNTSVAVLQALSARNDGKTGD